MFRLQYKHHQIQFRIPGMTSILPLSEDVWVREQERHIFELFHQPDGALQTKWVAYVNKAVKQLFTPSGGWAGSHTLLRVRCQLSG